MADVERAGSERVRIAGEVGEARVLPLEHELHVRQRHADAHPQAAREEVVALHAPPASARPEPVDELAPGAGRSP